MTQYVEIVMQPRSPFLIVAILFALMIMTFVLVYIDITDRRR